MSAVAPAQELFPKPVPPDQPVEKVLPGRSAEGSPALIAAAEVRRSEGRPSLVYQVALNSEHVEQWMDEYRRKLFVMVTGAVVATAFLGWFITRRSLRPLAEITATAQRITATGLDERIGGKVWPAELASLAAEFDRMLARLRESFERLSQFTADAAHEFRTPLNNLLGGTSLALARPRSPDEYNTLLEANLEEYARLNHMIESLLFLARADNTQTVLRKASIDAAVAMEEVVEFFSALAEDRGVSLGCSGGGALTADPALLRMALTNLVSNALRYAPRGTAVRLKAESLNGGGLAISVQDEGPGIAPEHLPRVFDRFYRVDGSRSTDGSLTGSSGLGLALVKTIMNLHGGSVTVESSPGRGALFRLQFPREAAVLN